MKAISQLCAAAVLTLAVTFSAYAGEIECGVMSTSPQATGEMPTGGITEMILLILALV